MAPIELPIPSAIERVQRGPDLMVLGRFLKSQRYNFTAVTPATHARVIARRGLAETLEDAFGWNLPFVMGLLPPEVFLPLLDAGLIETMGTVHTSKVRCASLCSELFFHSSFPTTNRQSVFFGPDTYRFCRLIRAVPGVTEAETICDIGCGSGVGGITASQLSHNPRRLVLADINALALDFAGANALLAGNSTAEFVESDVFASIEGQFDLIVSNPPYMADPLARRYRDGGGQLGLDLSIKILEQAVRRLTPNGRLVLYTGVAIVNGHDPFRDAVASAAGRARLYFEYDEIDPDVFGEELDAPTYKAADRIAAVGAIVGRSYKVET